MDGSRGSGSVAAGARSPIYRSRLELAIAPSAARIARHWTADQLARAGRADGQEPLDPDVADSAVLVVSELVTNAIRAVVQATPVGMMLPRRALSFGDRVAAGGRRGQAPQASPMCAGGWRLPAGPAAAATPGLLAGSHALEAASLLRSGGVLAPVPASVSLVIARFSDVLRIDVHDSSPLPIPPGCHRDAEDETGRGLTVVASLTEAWGWRPDAFGKVVWCELALAPRDVNTEAGG